MSNQQEASVAAESSIYDLGYQRYEGERIGRMQAIRSIYIESLRGAFGLGRSTGAKIAPWALIVIAWLPAVALLGSGILFGGNMDSSEIFEHHDYFGFINFVLALFVAIVAPDVVGRDQRSQTLSLYFSRALKRSDYALAKYAAMVTALLPLTLVPQALLYAGNALIVENFKDYITEEADLILPILAASVLVCAFLASIGLFISSLTPRRAFATVGIILAMIVTQFVSGTLTSIDSPGLGLAVYISPFDIMRGFGAFLFDVPLPVDDPTELAGYNSFTYVFAAIGVSIAGAGLLVRRYLRLQA